MKCSAITHLYVLSRALVTLFYINQVDCKDSGSENQRSKSNSNEFILWVINETTLTVLWEPLLSSSDFKEYKFHIKPPDSGESVRLIQNKGEHIFLNFTNLVPGRAYSISKETSNEEISPYTSSVVYRTIPLEPSVITIDQHFLTTHTFKIAWEPPHNLCDFDKYQVSVSTGTPLAIIESITKTFDKSERREYEVSQNVLPGHSYRIDVKTISGNIPSKSISVDVTLKPLPVQNATITEDSILVWHVDLVSQQDTFNINITDEESFENEEIAADKKELFIGKLSPGRKYLIQIEAISNGMRSEASTIVHITPPLPPVLEHVVPLHDGLDVSWQSDMNYGQEKFQVVFHRNDTRSVGEASNITTNNTQVFLTHLYPGALYSIRVISISKYGNHSASSEVYQGVRPVSPRNVTARYVNTNTLSVRWDVPQDSLISGYFVRYRTEDNQNWTPISCGAEETSQEIISLSSGERYKIQVASISHSVESSPVELQWITPPDPVTQVVPLLSSNAITLKFPQPEGRVDFYNVTWCANTTQTMSRFFPNKSNNTVRFVLISIENLLPGTSYMFTMTSVSYHMESSVTNVIARTWPVLDSELNVWDTGALVSTTSLVVHYIPPKMVHFDFFRFNLSESDRYTHTFNKSVNDNNTSVRFDSIIPGKLYKLYIWTVSDGMLSAPTHLQHRVQPGTVREVRATSVTNNSVTISWKIPPGEFSKFEVKYLDTVLETFSSSVNITKLSPYQNYAFQIRTLAGLLSSLPTRSSAVVVTVRTLESYPGRVSDFHPVVVNAHNITFAWSLPSRDQHGIIILFKLFCTLGEWSMMRDIPPEQKQVTVTGLKPGRIYSFKIQARTKVGYGPASVWKQEMPVLAPPQPSEQIFPTSVLQTTNTIQIRFRKNFFSDEHGEIRNYTIIVSEDLHDNFVVLKMQSWHDVQSFHPWPPYQVLEPYQFFSNSSVVDFTVGDETCVADVQYCNGPLKSGTTYKIKVRAFTSADLFRDTAYSNPISTRRNYTFFLYVGVVISCVFLMVLFVFIRRHSPRNKARDVSLHNRSHPISIAHFRTMRLDIDASSSCSWILREFEDLKLIGREQTTTAAELPCNRPKNRFSNILPYDNSRYKLQSVDDEEGSDYVNANYIAGYVSPRQYIATQGPLSTTRYDFWRMCWESKTPAIVMLTQCVEKGREKCYRYWPIGDSVVRCGDIDILLLHVSNYSGWSITRLRLSRGEESRDIYHFHFTTWPDCGVPQSPEALVRFVLSFRSRVSPEQNPIIVHCSAGIGRTGTFIAVDTIAQCLHKVGVTGSVDILGVVYQLRKQRMCMVQMEEQYFYIYLCVKLLLQRGAMSYSTESQDLIFSNEAFELDEGVDDL